MFKGLFIIFIFIVFNFNTVLASELQGLKDINLNDGKLVPITSNINLEEIFPDLPKDSDLYNKVLEIKEEKKLNDNKNISKFGLGILNVNAVSNSPYQYTIFATNIGTEVIDVLKIKATTTDSYGQFLGTANFTEYGIIPGFHRRNVVTYNFRPYIYALIELQVINDGKISNFEYMHYR